MSNQPAIIDVDHVSIHFRLNTQKGMGLKEFLIDLPKKKKNKQPQPEFIAVNDVSFTVRKGEAWGLVGRNGSGKSTLLKAISGILLPTEGNISVGGTIAPLLELGAGFQPELTARENVFMDGCSMGHSIRYMEEHFDEIIEFAELWDFLDTPLKNFSSGMRSRLGFAIATAVAPDILIVDEVLSVGDYKFRMKCENLLGEMLSKGTTLLFVSHNTKQVQDLCDHAIWLEKGHSVLQGDAATVCAEYMSAMKQ